MLVLRSRVSFPLQVIGGNFDMVMETLSQFLEFIAANVPLAQFSALLPSFQDLVQRYHLAPSIAMFVAQPAMYHVRMLQIGGGDVPDDVKKWDATGVRRLFPFAAATVTGTELLAVNSPLR